MDKREEERRRLSTGLFYHEIRLNDEKMMRKWVEELERTGRAKCTKDIDVQEKHLRCFNVWVRDEIAIKRR